LLFYLLQKYYLLAYMLENYYCVQLQDPVTHIFTCNTMVSVNQQWYLNTSVQKLFWLSYGERYTAM
jgi:hypothetical protein